MPRIVVKGDVSADWYLVPVPEDKNAAENWRLREGSRMLIQPGGALLLANLIRAAVGNESRVSSQILRGLRILSTKRAIRSYAELDAFKATIDDESKKKVFRVKRGLGFEGPTGEQPSSPPLANDDPDASMVVLDDAGNGFRDREEEWPLAVTTPGKKPLVIYKTSRPLAQRRLWEHLLKKHRDRLITVVGVNDLRLEGLQISRRFSWDRVAMDFLGQAMQHNVSKELCQSRHLIIGIGMDGALIHSRQGSQRELSLFFDPAYLEDGFDGTCPGRIYGLASAFVAGVTAVVLNKGLNKTKDGYEVEQGLSGVMSGVRLGLQSCRRLLKLGFGSDPAKLGTPYGRVFAPEEGAGSFTSARVPLEGGPAQTPEEWTILSQAVGSGLKSTAFELVRTGKAPVLNKVPMAKFGKLKTMDRSEIESLQSIRNLMGEYLQQHSPGRPLSVAVFGPPGAGKSFGVKQVADSLGDKRIVKHTFNVSQFTSAEDLVTALHKVRDGAIAGDIPLVFWDEFDSEFKGDELGWLKFFLAPMQDGEFKHGEEMHPIGQCIFVFAGGTAKSFGEFSRAGLNLADVADRKKRDKFEKVKGPDFVSRLRGFVNILGPNPKDVDKSSPPPQRDQIKDQIYLLRRAILLRSMLERKARHLIDAQGECQIDHGILAAMINVPRYHHGARSMESILDMSQLAGRKKFDPAALPPKPQLAMHVDSEEFLKMVRNEVNWASHQELLARAIHAKYLNDQKGEAKPGDLSKKPWEDLSRDIQESNRQQAAHLPLKLEAIGYGLRPAGKKPVPLRLGKKQIELLSEMEHERWNQERLSAGWQYGLKRDTEKKISPYLVSWAELEGVRDEDGKLVQDYDREAVKNIPALIKLAGFEAYKLE